MKPEISTQEQENPAAMEDENLSDTPMQVEDPTALYRKVTFDGNAVSAWDKLSRFAHNHKRKIYGLLLVSILGSIAISMRPQEPVSPDKIARNYFARFASQERSDWIYQVQGASIGEEFLGNLFRLLARTTFGNAGQTQIVKDNAAYREFVKDQFETDLLLNAALSEGVLESTESRFVIENALRHAIADYYVMTRTQKPDSDFRVKVTDEEVNSFYDKNRDTYAKNGLSKNDNLAIIARTLAGIKRQEINGSFMLIRRQMLEVIKNQGGHKVKDPIVMR